MSFSGKQVEMLEAPLDQQHVKSRKQAGQSLSYVEGWFVIAEANRIFGHDGWDRETELRELGEPQLGKDKYGNDQWRVRYMAKATVRVRAGDAVVLKQGVGFGSGIAKDLGDAYEGAIKEAETDATKRALMTFGWPFGLALYDKQQRHVENGNGAAKEAGPEPDTAKRDAYVEHCEKTVRNWKKSATELAEWWQGEAENRRKHGLTQGDVDHLKNEVIEQKKALETASMMEAG